MNRPASHGFPRATAPPKRRSAIQKITTRFSYPSLITLIMFFLPIFWPILFFTWPILCFCIISDKLLEEPKRLHRTLTQRMTMNTNLGIFKRSVNVNPPSTILLPEIMSHKCGSGEGPENTIAGARAACSVIPLTSPSSPNQGNQRNNNNESINNNGGGVRRNRFIFMLIFI